MSAERAIVLFILVLLVLVVLWFFFNQIDDAEGAVAALGWRI